MSELKRLQAESRRISERIGEIEHERASKESAQYVGRFFVADNSYGAGERWPWYFKCTGNDGRYVTGFHFERDNDGRCSINHLTHLYFESHGFTEITRGDWDAAWADFLAKLMADVNAGGDKK